MFQNLSHKKRFYYLVTGVILIILLGYNLALKKTFNLKSECVQIEKNIAELKDAPAQLVALKKKLNSIDRSVHLAFNKKQTIQDYLLEQIADYCSSNNILIREYPKPHQYNKDDYAIETSHIVLEGSYINLLKLLYHIEQKYRLGKVSSAKFYTVINENTKVLELILELYIQNINQNEK